MFLLSIKLRDCHVSLVITHSTRKDWMEGLSNPTASGWDTRASIKMQKAVGGKKVDEGCHIFPEYMREYTTDIYYETYMVYRKDW